MWKWEGPERRFKRSALVLCWVVWHQNNWAVGAILSTLQCRCSLVRILLPKLPRGCCIYSSTIRGYYRKNEEKWIIMRNRVGVAKNEVGESKALSLFLMPLHHSPNVFFLVLQGRKPFMHSSLSNQTSIYAYYLFLNSGILILFSS